jgi:L-lactate dehydrogenase complex protein LldG
VSARADTSARADILNRVRAATRDVPAGEDPSADIDRAYRRERGLSAVQAVVLFADRVADYGATVRRVGGTQLPETLTSLCRTRGAARLVVPVDLPPQWRPEGVELVPDHVLSYAELGSADGVLSGCAVAIAETGTVVLDSGPRQGRRALTLLPDYHLCVVEEEQVVGGVPEAIDRLEPSGRAGRPLTFVSGPSATSDIELERVEGVHGPRTLEVVVVG